MTSTATSLSAAPAVSDSVLAALERIERRLVDVERAAARLAPLGDALDAIPGGVATVVDSFDTLAGRMAERGIDVDARVASVLRAIEVSTTPRAVHGLAALVESQLLEPSALAVVSRLAAALAAPAAAAPIGAWGALRALRDPDIQRALGFVIAIARTFGRQLAAGEVDACRDRLLAVSEQPALLDMPEEQP